MATHSDVEFVTSEIGQVSIEETQELNRSQSIQCTEDEQEKCTLNFAQGTLLCSADASFLNPGKIQELTVGGKIKEAIEELRRDFSKEMRQLEDRLSAQNKELISMAKQRDDLKEELGKKSRESAENADQVKKLELNKTELEHTISSLQDEIRTLKERIEITVNQSKSFEEQIKDLQQKSLENKPETEVSKDALELAISNAVRDALSRFSIPQDMALAQKKSDIKQELKNGTDNYKDGNGGSHRS